MSPRIPIASKCYFLLMLAGLFILGCSSTDITGPNPSTTNTDADGGSAKITITTSLNEAHPVTSIGFDLPIAGYVYFEVTNATGYHVRTLLDRYLEAGAHSVLWDVTNDDGERIGSGIYLFHLVASGFETWQAASVYFPSDEPEGEV